MQSKTRTLLAHAQWLHECEFASTDAIAAWVVEYSGQMISRNQRHTSDGKTSYELRKQKPYRRQLIPFSEMCMHMLSEKPRSKGDERWYIGVDVGLVDRSNELVIGTK